MTHQILALVAVAVGGYVLSQRDGDGGANDQMQSNVSDEWASPWGETGEQGDADEETAGENTPVGDVTDDPGLTTGGDKSAGEDSDDAVTVSPVSGMPTEPVLEDF